MKDERLLDNFKLVSALAPSADAYNGDPDSDVVNLAKYSHVTFLLFAVATTGEATVIVKEASAADKTGAAAIAARYKKLDVSNSPVDALDSSDYTAIATTGFVTGNSETAIYAVEVRDTDTSNSKPYVFLDFTEDVDAAVIGGCIAVLGGARFKGNRFHQQ